MLPGFIFPPKGLRGLLGPNPVHSMGDFLLFRQIVVAVYCGESTVVNQMYN